MFSLDKLKVYDKALTNAASLAQRSQSWDRRHAVTDQLLRASESFVLNLAEGARLRSPAKRPASARLCHWLGPGMRGLFRHRPNQGIPRSGRSPPGEMFPLRSGQDDGGFEKGLVGGSLPRRTKSLWKAGGVAFSPRTTGCLSAQRGIHAVVSRLAWSAQTLDAPAASRGSYRHESGVEHCRSQRALCAWREAESVRDSRKCDGPVRNVSGALHTHRKA